MTRNSAHPLKRTADLLGIDLDAVLAKRTLDPVPVTLGGRVWLVRRDLTGAQVTEYFALVNEGGKDVEAMTLLVGTDAVALMAVLDSLPRQHMTMAVQEIMRAAELVAAVPASDRPSGAAAGEFSAS